MKRILIIFALFLLGAIPAAASTVTAATCAQADVKAVIVGPTHTAVDGDVIVMPTGACSWTSSAGGLVVPAGIGITITGTGTPASGYATIVPDASCTGTTITWTIGSNHMITITPGATASTSRISCMGITTTGATGSSAYPLQVSGMCNGSGCPQLRVDNITAPTGSACSISDSSFLGADNVFGDTDHNSVGDIASACNGIDWVNVTLSSYLGVGSWGDNSMSQPDTFGGANQFVLENNSFNYSFGTDVDNGNGGAGRFTCRDNTFYEVTPASACTNHGTESTGRPRGGRQMEAYDNTLICVNSSQGCSSAFGNRSGVGYVWRNTLTCNPTCGGANPFYGSIFSLTAYRAYAGVGTQFDGWGVGYGNQSYDTNDNSGAAYYSGTLTGTTGTTTPTDAAQIWTITFGSSTWAATAAAAGTPYSFFDSTNGCGGEIQSSSGNNLVFTSGSGATSVGANPISNWAAQTTCTYTLGDSYGIYRALVLIDQPTRSGGTLVSGNPASPTTANGQTLDPDYEWMDAPTHINGLPIRAEISHLLKNRDYYNEGINQTAQTNATSPFDGTTTIGVGHGTRANRPTTCTTGVIYFSTDQGSWNTAPGGLQGVLDKCTSTNTWTNAVYVPYTYPDPLDSGNSPASTPVPSPAAGTYVGTQSVTLATASGSVQCYNFTGAPATNGTTGCAIGTLYTGSISIASTSTIYYVAGGTGFTDSSVGSAAYTITAAPPTSISGATIQRTTIQ